MNGKLKNNCFLVKVFNLHYLNVKPRSQFDMTYKIKKRFDNLDLMKSTYKIVLRLKAQGKTKFIGDTRSGPINVEVTE